MSGGEAAKKGSMGFWSCTALVIGNMVGSGVFLLPSSLAAYGGATISSGSASAGMNTRR